ncbi:MAG: 30S ribosomal protein S20 [Chitinophagales bacterium]
MANSNSAKKRIRQIASRRLRNRYYAKTMRTLVRKVRTATDKTTADANIKEAISIIDKLSKKNFIHSNKAANLKSKLMKHYNSLS